MMVYFRPMTGQVPRVIIEGNPMSDDEEDRIVQAAVFDQATAVLSQAGADEFMGGEQGKLVEQILRTNFWSQSAAA